MVLTPDQHFLVAVLLPIILFLVVWEMIWKGIALWKAGRNNQMAWFICILIFNTVGILPIIYLLWFQKPTSSAQKKELRPVNVTKKKKR